MRFKILAYTFSVPLVWLTLLLIKYYAPHLAISHFFSSGVLTGLFIGSILVRLLLDSKYLTGLTIDKNVIELTYLTSFGSLRHTTLMLDTLTEIKVKKKLLLIRDFGLLKLSQIDNEKSFLLYNSNLNQEIEVLMNNISNRQLLKK
ncbi:MAG: hypothetical protein JST02_02920 [Bacteroidetes bacterium]|nr:hypothetical protein [Bacteroidota bacterium]